VGASGLGAVDATGQSSPIQLASEVLQDGSTGHIALITVLACVVFLTVLTAMTSVTFAAAVSLTHDVFARGKRLRTETQELRALRMAAVSVCAVGLSLAAAIHRYPTEFLVAFSISVAATCVFPALIYSSSGVASTVEAYCGPSTGDYCSAPSSRPSPPSSRAPRSRYGRKPVLTGTRSRPQA
jgi:cation/acetate symporter